MWQKICSTSNVATFLCSSIYVFTNSSTSNSSATINLKHHRHIYQPERRDNEQKQAVLGDKVFNLLYLFFHFHLPVFRIDTKLWKHGYCVYINRALSKWWGCERFSLSCIYVFCASIFKMDVIIAFLSSCVARTLNSLWLFVLLRALAFNQFAFFVFPTSVYIPSIFHIW